MASVVDELHTVHEQALQANCESSVRSNHCFEYFFSRRRFKYANRCQAFATKFSSCYFKIIFLPNSIQTLLQLSRKKRYDSDWVILTAGHSTVERVLHNYLESGSVLEGLPYRDTSASNPPTLHTLIFPPFPG